MKNTSWMLKTDLIMMLLHPEFTTVMELTGT